jgi:hypothetical protein
VITRVVAGHQYGDVPICTNSGNADIGAGQGPKTVSSTVNAEQKQLDVICGRSGAMIADDDTRIPKRQTSWLAAADRIIRRCSIGPAEDATTAVLTVGSDSKAVSSHYKPLNWFERSWRQYNLGQQRFFGLADRLTLNQAFPRWLSERGDVFDHGSNRLATIRASDLLGPDDFERFIKHFRHQLISPEGKEASLHERNARW